MSSWRTFWLPILLCILCLHVICNKKFLWQETYTEAAGLQRFGAFYLDYLYTMENESGKGTASHTSLLLLSLF